MAAKKRPTGMTVDDQAVGVMTPEQRSMRASVAANARWSRVSDRKAAMEPAHRGLLEKFEREVDPDGVLSPADRALRAENARKAHYKRMALRSSQHRSDRKRRSA